MLGLFINLMCFDFRSSTLNFSSRFRNAPLTFHGHQDSYLEEASYLLRDIVDEVLIPPPYPREERA